MSLTKLSLAGKYFNYSRPGRVWSVTSCLGTGKPLTIFYSVAKRLPPPPPYLLVRENNSGWAPIVNPRQKDALSFILWLWALAFKLMLALQMTGREKSNIIVLFGISFTLKPNKKLTKWINYFHLWSVFFQIENLSWRTRNCHQPLHDGSSLPFSPLLWLSQEFSHAMQ